MYKSYRASQCHRSPGGVKIKKKEFLRHQVRKQFVDSVSMAGLAELYHAANSAVRWMWITVIAVSIGSIIYHTVLLIEMYTAQSATFQVMQKAEQPIPFPKITVCSAAGVNKTFLIPHVNFPSRDKRILDNMTEDERRELKESVAGLLGNSFRFMEEKWLKPSSPNYTLYHHGVIQTYDDFPHYIMGLWLNGMGVSCENIISNCQMNGVKYDCCKNSKLEIDDDGPCYDIKADKQDVLMNHNRFPMLPVALNFDLQLDWDHVLPFSTTNGFSIHVSDPYSVLGRPIPVPAGSHTRIHLSQPTLRKEKSLCFDGPMPNLESGPSYDAKGSMCKMERFIEETMANRLGCTYPMGSYYPKENEACMGTYTLPIKMTLFHGAGNDQRAIEFEKGYRQSMFEIMHSKTRCLPLCTSWEFSPQPSYSEILLKDYSTLDAGPESAGNVSKSRVTIYMGSEYYMERVEQELTPMYNTFVQITFVIQLYLGFSVITVAEIVFYAFRICKVYRDTRTQVGPIEQCE